MVVFLLLTGHCLAQVMPIGQARKLRPGTQVTIAGVVTASKEFGDLSFLQDPSGGLPIYSAGVAASLSRGDSVVVEGKLSRFNGLLEIIPDVVRNVGRATAEVHPGEVDLRQVKEHEGELVRIAGVFLKPSGHFFYPQRAGSITGITDTLNYWIDGDTDLPGYSIPPRAVTVTGVVGKYRDQVQLMPRSAEDIPGLIPPTVTSNLRHLSIMTWNLEFFGATREKYGSEYGPSDEDKQIANVATLLNAVHPDIAALQEVSDDAAFSDLLKRIPGYEGRCSSRYSYSHDTSGDFPPQKLCFIHKTGVARVVREKILFKKLYDEALGSQSNLLDSAPGGAAGVFASGRLPYLLEVDVSLEGASRRITLVNVHGKSGTSADDHARRTFDARLLKDSLDRYFPDRKLVIHGDFNDDLDVSIIPGRVSPYAQFVDDPGYACITKLLSDQDWASTISYDDMIDHQVVSAALAEIHVAGSSRIVNPFGLIARYSETTSDHLPVVSEFDLNQVVTGVVEHGEISVFPNPARGTIHIVCPGYFEYRIVNVAGAILSLGSGVDRVALDVASGVFFLKLIQDDKLSTFHIIGQ